MERKNPYLKIAAVVSAVLLIGAFVSYRAGAFQQPIAPEPPTAAAPQSDAEDQPATDAGQQAQTFMYSSKSAPAFTISPAAPAAPPNPPAPGSPTYMGGSKSKVIFIPEPRDGATAADPAKPAAPNPPKP